MMRLVLLEPPVNEPLTAAEAKERSNIGSEVSDVVMEAYITAARQRIDGADGWLGRALITQTWEGFLDQWPIDYDDGRIMIPLPPVQSISSVSYLDADGLAVVVDRSAYQLVQGQRPYLIPAFGVAWPAVGTRAGAITITFIAGYGDNGSDVPEPIRTAISLACGLLSSMSTRRLSVALEREEGIGETRYAVNTNPSEVIDLAVENLLSTYRITWV